MPFSSAQARHRQQHRRLTRPFEIVRRTDNAEFQRIDQLLQVIDDFWSIVADQLRMKGNPHCRGSVSSRPVRVSRAGRSDRSLSPDRWRPACWRACPGGGAGRPAVAGTVPPLSPAGSRRAPLKYFFIRNNASFVLFAEPSAATALSPCCWRIASKRSCMRGSRSIKVCSLTANVACRRRGHCSNV